MIYPDPVSPEEIKNFNDILGIIGALIEENHEDFSSSFFGHPADYFNVRPNLEDVKQVLKRIS